MEKQYQNAMLEEIKKLPSVMRSRFCQLEEKVRLFFSDEEIFDICRIYMIGCGDSHMAAAGASLAYGMFTEKTVIPMTALQFSRYASDSLCAPQKRNLIIALSQSGETARVIEAMMRAAGAGARTAAFTGNISSRLARAAQKTMVLDIPVLQEGVPGLTAYMFQLLALELLAVRIGEVTGKITMDKAGKLRKMLSEIPGSIEQFVKTNEEMLREFAAVCDGAGCAEFLGAGPNLGTAKFGCAKLIEAAGTASVYEEIEEFAHIQYFEVEPKTRPVILLSCEKSRSRTRILEIEDILKKLKRPYLKLETSTEEWLSPFVLSAALYSFGAYVWEMGEEKFFRGHEGVWASDGIAGVRGGEIEKR